MTHILKHIAIPMSIITETGVSNADVAGVTDAPHRVWASRSWRRGSRHSDTGEHFREESGAWGFGLSNSLHD
jgi:hypothetical protein